MTIEYADVIAAFRKAFNLAESNWRTPKDNLRKVDGVSLAMVSFVDALIKDKDFGPDSRENFYRHCEFDSLIAKGRRLRRQERQERQEAKFIGKKPAKKPKAKAIPLEPLVIHERAVRNILK